MSRMGFRLRLPLFTILHQIGAEDPVSTYKEGEKGTGTEDEAGEWGRGGERQGLLLLPR